MKAPSPTGMNTGVPVAVLLHARNVGGRGDERLPVNGSFPDSLLTGAASRDFPLGADGGA